MSERDLPLSRLVNRLGQLALKPIDVFATGTEMVAQTARGVQDLAGESIDAVSGPLQHTLQPEAARGGSEDLDDLMVKLVEYAVVSIEPGGERVLESDQVLVAEPMGGEAFAAWRIADYLQRGGKQEIEPEAREFLRVSFQVMDRWPAEES